MRCALGLWIAFGLAAAAAEHQPRAAAGVALADLSWVEAESVLTPSSVVVIPLGVATVEHGPHLKLNNNERLARYLASRIQSAAPVVVAPTLTYSFSPAFVEYPGSTSLSRETTVRMVLDIVRSFARQGPRRFYVLNTTMATLPALQAAAATLASEGVLLEYTNVMSKLENAAAALRQAPLRVAHADEVETSMMLYVDPSAVDMTKAVSEYGEGFGPMTRRKGEPGVFSASGVLGDATLATREKGRALVEALVSGVLADIDNLRRANVPDGATSGLPARDAVASWRSTDRVVQSNGCTPGDERIIREIGPRFSSDWHQADAVAIAELFTPGGDMRHPDGTIERGRAIILSNRQELFKRREYRGSIHGLQLTDVRCLGSAHAIADGKWELRLMDGTSSAAASRGPVVAQTFSGWCTLVLSGGGTSWSIEAWRYTIDPPKGEPLPTTLKQPGFIGRERQHD
jgi:creatinine amidohydrolase